MASEPTSITPAPEFEETATRGRVRTLFGRSRVLLQIAYRDPENVAERLTLALQSRLGEPTALWAQRARTEHPQAEPSRLADEVRGRSARVARIDGAIAGSPFFVALVPGYVGYLWQAATMVLRIGALYGGDPASPEAAAELLALRGIHPSVAAASDALARVAATPLPDKPESRRSWRVWLRSVKLMLVFSGFLSSPHLRSGDRGKILTALAAIAGAALWVVTWIFPVTFMIAMSWSCEHDTRQLGRRAQAFYGGEAPTPADAIRRAGRQRDRGRGVRATIRSAALFLSIAIPIAFVAAADKVRNTTHVHWVVGLGALVALSVVIATAVISRRR